MLEAVESRNICIIEDDKEVAESVKDYMESVGYVVQTYSSAEEFQEDPPNNFCGVYLIDWNLPGAPGVDVVRQIREEDKISPIFIVSANSEKEDIVEGLKTGADDYILKPFSYSELAVRVDNASSKYNLILKNSWGDDLRLLPEANSFVKEGKTISLTAKEYKIFSYLQDRTGQPVARDEIMKNCFQGEEKVTNRNVDVHIFSLRKKLSTVEMRIETVWGKGYKLL